MVALHYMPNLCCGKKTQPSSLCFSICNSVTFPDIYQNKPTRQVKFGATYLGNNSSNIIYG